MGHYPGTTSFERVVPRGGKSMTAMFARTAGFLIVLLLTMGPRVATAQEWTLMSGAARDVGVGANGTVWVIGTNQVPGGYGIYRWTGSGWTNIPGGAERIAVDPSGNAWVVNNTQNIFRFDGTKWVQVSGSARDVGVGANGTVWVIGNNAEGGGYGIYRSTDQGASWTKVPGSALRISVDPQGNAWVVNSSNNIFRFNGSSWVQLPGAATDVGVGPDGSAWVIGTDSGIYRWEGSNWARKTGGAAQIAAGRNGVVWVVNQGNQIYQASVPPAAGGELVVNLPPIPVITQPAPTGTITLQGEPIVLQAPSAPAAPQPQLTVTGGPPPLPYRVGPVGTSEATCGVLGKGLCRPVAAELKGNADIICPTGTFPDLGRSACFSCPQGFTRSIHAVDNYKACQRPDSSVTRALMSASYKGPLCGEGTFYHLGTNECYSCPAGYNRSAAPIDAPNACFIPMREEFSHPTHHKRTIWPHECSSGTFWDGYNGGNCYSCPSGFRRTAYAISDSRACARTVGEQQARATLVKKAECGPGEIRDDRIQGTQNFARGGGCWTCPIGTDRTVHPIDGAQACERAPGVQWASATRARGMTCEANEIFDPVSSGNPSVASALAARNAANPASPVQAKSIGGTCWECPPGFRRNASTVFGGAACDPPGIAWKPAPYNQPGLFGLRGAEAVALKLVAERTVINTIIRDLQASGTAPANFAQTAWDQIGTRPQDSAVLAMAVFSRVVEAATDPSRATPDERALLEDVIEQIRLFRVFMAQDALNAYLAWKGGEDFRKSLYARSQLQVMTDTGEVPPDFEQITAESIMASLGATIAANTAIYMTMSSAQVFKSLFPFAVRAITKSLTAAATAAGKTVTQAAITAASSSAGAALSAGPQIIVTFGLVVLQVAIEQQIAIATAEPKLRAGVATATNSRTDFARLMATPEGSAQAQSHWAMLMAGPAPRQDGTRPPAIAPQNLPAFAQQAAAAKQALVASAR